MAVETKGDRWTSSPVSDRWSGRGATAAPLAILLVAAALRLPLLAAAPPGLNQDEAINAWDAYCLLKTGADSNGAAWPLFYTRGFGSNRSALFLYMLLPFEALGGLSVTTARLAAAIYGVAAVLLMYAVGKRLFGPACGLLAALLLAIVPWHVQLSRNANEPTICVLLVLLPLAALLQAQLPFRDEPDGPPRAVWAGAAGVLAGVCCYGYAAARLFLPLFLTAAVLVTWRAWWRCLRTPAGARALAALALGVAATFGPLLLQHAAHADEMILRGQQTWVWSAGDPPIVRAAKVIARYPAHFGPDFLFSRGDHYVIQAPPGGGQLRWFMLPLLLAGAAATVRRVRSSQAARLLLVWVLLYPAGDLLPESLDNAPHALRSFPGLGGLILLAALGAVAGWHWLRKRGPGLALGATAGLALMAAAETARFVWLYLGEYGRTPAVYHAFHVDLMRACDRLRPRLDGIDAVFCTVTEMNMPYSVLVVGLGSTPAQWFSEPHRTLAVGGWDTHVRDGKLNFLYWDDWKPAYEALRRNGRPDRVLFLVRPGELGLRDCPERIEGLPETLPLLLCERTL
jgi:hypothetical protein